MLSSELNPIKSYKDLKLVQLVKMAQTDDFKALEELVRREQNNIYVTLCYLEDKNVEPLDLTQEVLIRMAQNIKKLKKPQVFKSWLNQITMHVFYDSLRKKRKRPMFISLEESSFSNAYSQDIADIADNSIRPDDKSLSNELDRKIQEAILNLPLTFRMPIILRELQGMTYEEIANSLNTNIGTIKSRIARARNRLEEDLRAYVS